MYKKAWYTCKMVVLLIKPIAFVAFPLPSPSSDLKVPIALDKMGVYVLATFLTKEGEQSLQTATNDTLRTFQLDVKWPKHFFHSSMDELLTLQLLLVNYTWSSIDHLYQSLSNNGFFLIYSVFFLLKAVRCMSFLVNLSLSWTGFRQIITLDIVYGFALLHLRTQTSQVL